MSIDSFTHYKVAQYMYCHPNNVIVRKGQPKVLQWQHIMASSEIVLTTKHSPESGKVDSISVCQGTQTLESLEPLHKLLRRSLAVISMNEWVCVRWTTRKGSTQFQIQFESIKSAMKFVASVEHSKVKVHRRQSAEAVNQQPEKLLNNVEASQSTQTNYPQDSNLHQASQVFNDATQVEPEFWNKQVMEAKQTFAEYNDDGAKSCMSKGQVTTTSAFVTSEQVSLYGRASRMSTVSQFRPMRFRDINIVDYMRRRKPLYLKVDTYTYAQQYVTHQNKPVKWHHVGMASDICLTLMPADHNGQPVIILTRGIELLDAFAPHPQYIRAFFSDEILALAQTGFSLRSPDRIVQLHMRKANVALACEWLAHWEVFARDPSDNKFMEAESMTTWSKKTSHTHSVRSRQSHFWARRLGRTF